MRESLPSRTLSLGLLNREQPFGLLNSLLSMLPELSLRLMGSIIYMCKLCCCTLIFSWEFYLLNIEKMQQAYYVPLLHLCVCGGGVEEGEGERIRLPWRPEVKFGVLFFFFNIPPFFFFAKASQWLDTDHVGQVYWPVRALGFGSLCLSSAWKHRSRGLNSGPHACIASILLLSYLPSPKYLSSSEDKNVILYKACFCSCVVQCCWILTAFSELYLKVFV